MLNLVQSYVYLQDNLKVYLFYMNGVIKLPAKDFIRKRIQCVMND